MIFYLPKGSGRHCVQSLHVRRPLPDVFPPAAMPIVSNNAADVLQCRFVDTGAQPMGFT